MSSTATQMPIVTRSRLCWEGGTPVPLFISDAARPNVVRASKKPFLRRFRSVFDRLREYATSRKCRGAKLLARWPSPTPLKNGENGRNGRVLERFPFRWNRARPVVTCPIGLWARFHRSGNARTGDACCSRHIPPSRFRLDGICSRDRFPPFSPFFTESPFSGPRPRLERANSSGRFAYRGSSR